MEEQTDMSLISLNDMMKHAKAESYAVGYFETWDLRSMISVLRAAESVASPVIVGFSGIYLPRFLDEEIRWFASYAQAGRAAAEAARIPVSYIFNESYFINWVEASMDYGFNIVMFSDEGLTQDERTEKIAMLVEKAHGRGIAVEAEMGEPPDAPHARGSDFSSTDPDEAEEFVRKTNVDALGIVAGNRHSEHEQHFELDIGLIERIDARAGVPLVLHAGSSVDERSMKEAVRAGIRKVNIGRAVKKATFHSVQDRSSKTGMDYPGYEILGAGGPVDLFGGIDEAIGDEVKRLMELFGSTGKAV
jgi:fructose/tagatose bisphosphate aldolase